MANATIESNYDADLAAALDMLAARLETAIASGRFVAEQLPGALDDALNNEWHEGIEIADWAEKAANRVGI